MLSNGAVRAMTAHQFPPVVPVTRWVDPLVDRLGFDVFDPYVEVAWLPVIGDPLTIVAGALRVNFLWFITLVTIGKAARYLFVAGAFSWLSA